MGLRIKNFNIMASLKNPIFRGGGAVMENQYIGQLHEKGGGLGVFKGMVDTPMHTMKTPPFSIIHLVSGFNYVLRIMS